MSEARERTSSLAFALAHSFSLSSLWGQYGLGRTVSLRRLYGDNRISPEGDSRNSPYNHYSQIIQSPQLLLQFRAQYPTALSLLFLSHTPDDRGPSVSCTYMRTSAKDKGPQKFASAAAAVKTCQHRSSRNHMSAFNFCNTIRSCQRTSH